MLLCYKVTTCELPLPVADGTSKVSASQLLGTDMSGKVVTHMVLPKMAKNTSVRLYKVAKRIQVHYACWMKNEYLGRLFGQIFRPIFNDF